MKESTKRLIRKADTAARRSVESYKGKPVSLEEAVRVVNEFRKEQRGRKTARSH